jgi:hypothetical protein
MDAYSIHGFLRGFAVFSCMWWTFSVLWETAFQKAGSMNNAYSWVRMYRCVLLETNFTLMSKRISEAREAIDERLSRPFLYEGHEHRAIRDAWSGLAEFDAERTEREIGTYLRRSSWAVPKK